MTHLSKQLGRILILLVCGFLLVLATNNVRAGGSGWNVIVVVNQSSSNSCIVGNYYSEMRSIPPENVLRIYWLGNSISWTASDYAEHLFNPLIEMCSLRGLTNQIDYVVLSMDIPFQTIENGTNINSTTSALFYGLKTNASNGTPEVGITNSYFASERVFRDVPPASAPSASFLATMITGSSVTEAKRMIDQGVISDGSFPSLPVILAKSSDKNRNIRHKRFDNAIFNANVLGKSSIIRTNSNTPFGLTNLLGYQTGLQQFSVSFGTFRPGAIADSMTSFGGNIFGGNSQTSLLAFIGAGASGSYGTVAEPGSDGNDFPDPQVYFYQARGYSLAETYYQSIDTPYLGLTVAEPLASPFAIPGNGSWISSGISNAILSGITELGVHFRAHDHTRPLQQIDLLVDGKYIATQTNLVPQSGNILNITLNGYPISYLVASNSTLSSIASGLASNINASTVTNATKIRAMAYGDRIELQSLSTNHNNFPFYATNHSSTVITGAQYRVSNLTEAVPPRMIPVGQNAAGNYGMQMEIPTAMNYVIQATTNLVDWIPVFTNTVPGLVEYYDAVSTNFIQRFYRVVGPVVNQSPTISSPAFTNGGAFRLRMESQIGQPAAVLVSSNQLDWYPAETNHSGGIIDWVDHNAVSFSSRFYRAWLVPTQKPTISLSNSTVETTLVRVENAIQPYVVEVCTNGGEWVGVTTNYAFSDIQTTVSSAVGSAAALTTFVYASQPAFKTTPASGIEEFRVPASSLAVGAWLRFVFMKTNGQTVVIGVTNQVAGANSTNLAAEIISLVDNHTELQGPDGIVVEDVLPDSFQTKFTFRARSPGFQAAQFKVYPGRFGLNVFPSLVRTLTKNISDLQPRNHLYVTSGAGQINAKFSLDTTTLPDGYHELTSVAYEGSSVRTQTRTTVPVRVQNTSLTATMTLLDLTNNASVQGSYQIQVAANTTNISSITLFSTGGSIAVATNVSNVIFPVHGTNLWEGLHPFYAFVESSGGAKYRTRTEWIRLSP